MIGATASYASYARDLTGSLQRIANQKSVQTATKAFEKQLSNVDSVDEFMSQKSVYTYALKAFGLEDSMGAKALVKKVLAGGAESGSLASKLSDPGFKKLAAAFTFDADGKATFSGSVVAAVESAYYRQTMENAAGQSNAGSQLALYFQRSASSITNVWGVLADSNVFQVVRTALGLPDQMVNLSIDAQAAAIEGKLDVADLQDPDKVAKLIAKFTARYDAKSATATTSPVLELLASLRSTDATANGSAGAASILKILSSR